MPAIKPALVFNCPEKWDKMKIGLLSRYCENCQRDVHDFTTSSKSEILEFLLANRNSKVCGRIFKSQLDYHHEEILITIKSYIHRNRNSNLSFYFLALGTMILLGCSSDTNSDKNNSQDLLTSISEKNDLHSNLTSSDSKKCEINKSVPELAILGELQPVDNSVFFYDPNTFRAFAEVMPQWPNP